MKQSLLLILLLSQITIYNIKAQNIAADPFQNQLIQEDFNQTGDIFKTITTSDNYFILDNGDYFLSRNNNESEFAIFANNSEVSDFLLKTAIRIGPSSNKKSSIGLILKAQKNANGAIIFEVNKQKEFRIKQLIENKYQILSGNKKNDGWIKTKLLNGIDEINYIEIRSENNVYDIYINSVYLSTFFVPDYTLGSCGLIIGPKTKARISYFYLNTKEIKNISLDALDNNSSKDNLHKKIKILEENNLQLNELNTNIQRTLNNEINEFQIRNSNLEISLNGKNQEIANLKNKINEINKVLESSTQSENKEIKKLQDENTNLQKSILEKENQIIKLSKLNTLIEEIKLENFQTAAELQELKSNIDKKDKFIIKLNDSINTVYIQNEILYKSIDSLKSTTLSLKESLLNKKTENKKVKKNLDDKNKDYTNIKSKNNQLLIEVNSLNTEIVEYQNKLLNINSEFTNEKLTNDSLNNLSINNLKNKNNNLITKLKELEDTFFQEDKRKEELLVKCQNISRRLENDIIQLNDTNVLLIKKLEKNKQTNSFLNSSNNSLKIDLENSEKSLKKLQNESNKKIKNLQEKNNNISLLNKQANQNIKKFKEENQQNTNTIQNQRQEIEKLSSDVTNLYHEIKSLKDTKEKNFFSIQNLKKENILLRDSLNNLINKNQELRSKITELKNLFVEKNFEANGITTNEVIKTEDNKNIKSEKINNIIYTVKLGVYMKIQSNNQIQDISNIWYEETQDGNYIYYSGEFKNPIDAQNHLHDIKLLGYKDIYVVIKEE